MHDPTTHFPGQIVNRPTRDKAPVTFRIESSAVIISRDGTDETWDFADLRFAKPAKRGSFRLGPDGGENFLVVADPAGKRALARRFPALRTGLAALPAAKRFAVYAGGLIAATILLSIVAIEILPRAALMVMPRSWEREKGVEVVTALAGSAGYCFQPEGRQALDDLTRMLTAGAGLPVDTFQVQVVDKPVPNALATLGGQIALFRGLIDKAERPDELAGVLAHEMGHVIARHSMHNLVREMGMAFVGQVIGGGQMPGSGISAKLASIAYTRDAEQEADRTAISLLRHANISPAGLKRILVRLDSGNSPLAYFSTHPASSDRLGDIGRATGRADANLTAEQWKAIKAICD